MTSRYAKLALTAALASLCVTQTLAQTQPPTAFCDDINANLTVPTSIFSVLGFPLGAYPLAELASQPSPILAQASRLGRPAMPVLAERFAPTPELEKTFAEYSGYSDLVQVLGFRDSSVHALWSLGGSDNCMTFEFFNAPKGQKAYRLPPLPEGLPDLCEPHAGHLIQWRGKTGFLVRSEAGGQSLGTTLRYIPLEDDKWGKGCKLDIAIDPVFVPTKIFRKAAAALSESLLQTELPNIVKSAAGADRLNGNYFRYSNTAEPARDTYMKPITQIYKGDITTLPLPTFGATDAEAAAQAYSPTQNPAHGSVRLNGASYLTRVWITKPSSMDMKWLSYAVILYPVAEDAAVLDVMGEGADSPAAASAIVEMRVSKPVGKVSVLE